MTKEIVFEKGIITEKTNCSVTYRLDTNYTFSGGEKHSGHIYVVVHLKGQGDTFYIDGVIQ